MLRKIIEFSDGLLDGDIVKVPLYHGTTSVFRDSIEKYGLGGIDPVRQLGVIDLLSEASQAADSFASDDQQWLVMREATQLMISQSTGSFNFQHGSVYLSLVKSTAMEYARDNVFGSEVISRTADVLTMLKRNNVFVSDNTRARYADCFNFLNQNHTPIVVTVHNVPVAALRNERPIGSVKEVLKSLEEDLVEYRHDTFLLETLLARYNFRTIRPIHDLLTFEDV